MRFLSRLDRPDELEVMVGRIRPTLVLVSIDEVEDVSSEQERVLLAHDPRRRRARYLPHELLARTREKLRVSLQ